MRLCRRTVRKLCKIIIGEPLHKKVRDSFERSPGICKATIGSCSFVRFRVISWIVCL